MNHFTNTLGRFVRYILENTHRKMNNTTYIYSFYRLARVGNRSKIGMTTLELKNTEVLDKSSRIILRWNYDN